MDDQGLAHNSGSEEKEKTGFDQHDQNVHGAQTRIAGDPQGAVISGEFDGPVHIDDIHLFAAGAAKRQLATSRYTDLYPYFR